MRAKNRDFGSHSRSQVRRIVLWGTYDKGKPRVRILIQGLQENGVEVVECHSGLWEDFEDKGRISGTGRWIRLSARWMRGCAKLVFRYLEVPRHDLVVVAYPGIIDLLILWPLAKLRRVTLVLDAFISLYGTAVQDRALLSPFNPLAWLLFGVEWLACQFADRVILDTAAHARYFEETFRLSRERLCVVPVGAETRVFSGRTTERSRYPRAGSKLSVLFYGQFIPLHGIDVVVRAAKLTEADGIHWTMIGKGQEESRIRHLVNELRPNNLRWVDWVPYEELPERITEADVCLGIFGKTRKAGLVIPNKVYQALSVGTPMITGDTPAIREFLKSSDSVLLVPVGDPHALAEAAKTMKQRRTNGMLPSPRLAVGPKEVGRRFMEEVKRMHIEVRR